MRVTNPGTTGVTSVTGTAPVVSSGGTTPAISLSPMTYWAVAGNDAAVSTIGFLLNQVNVVGVLVTWPLSVGHIRFNVSTPDNSANLYDIGFYNAAGSLVANVGAASYTTGGRKSAAIAQGTVTLNPGLYWLGITGNGTTLALSAYGTGNLNWVFGGNTNVATSSGGNLPASITPPTVTPDNTFSVPWVALIP